MTYLKKLAAIILMLTMLTACAPAQNEKDDPYKTLYEDVVKIELSDDAVTVDGESAGNDETAAVYVANDIVYYEEGKDFTYGEGTDNDAHSADEAAAHTVVHIAKAGTYSLSGKLSQGQIAIDLGDDAEEDPDAVVTLILNGTDITCSVAPAVIFYNVYECGSSDTETATKDVDTSAAGANVIIADGTENTVNGSYVARIYKPGTVELSEDGSEVLDAKKLHKYDAAFYSKMTMNVNGGSEGTGILNINAENEGLDSELHLTVNGGNINIKSGNDGINTNEDYVSVTTINGGSVNIEVTGETGEGDGIDSNGWLVINGGSVTASACAFSGDAGIDSDMGIHINGGTVIATGHMLDRIEDGGQNYAVFNFAGTQSGENVVSLKNEVGEEVVEILPVNDYSVLVYSGPELKEGTYTLWSGDAQLAGAGGGNVQDGFGMGGGMRPDGMTPPEMPEDGEVPEGMEIPEGMERPEMPEGMEKPEDMEIPGGAEFPGDMERPEGERPGGDFGEGDRFNGELSARFNITNGGNMFQNVAPAE